MRWAYPGSVYVFMMAFGKDAGTGGDGVSTVAALNLGSREISAASGVESCSKAQQDHFGYHLSLLCCGDLIYNTHIQTSRPPAHTHTTYNRTHAQLGK